MRDASRGKLGRFGAAFAWLFEPMGTVDQSGRAFLLGQLLGAPSAAIMGSFCAISVEMVALLRSGNPLFGLFVGLDLTLSLCRLLDWRYRSKRMRADSGFIPVVDIPILLSLLWCTLQGSLAFTIMAGGDPVLQVLSAMLIMAIIGPICARNYAAPRFAFLLVLLCNIPFVLGALLSGEPWFIILVPMTPPFVFGAVRIIGIFHRTVLMTLAAEARNLHLAQHDSLTGILNRQGMDEALSRIEPLPNRNMALICVDLDGFKQVNDTHGHGAGDTLLVEVAGRIRRELRAEDLLARMGGDEFMAIVRDMAPEDIGPLAERLIAAISNRPYDVGGETPARVGASIGYACLPEDAASTLELRLRADQALYAAKGDGKGVGRRYRAAYARAAASPRGERHVSSPVREAKERRRTG